MTVHETTLGRIQILRAGSGGNSIILLHAAASGPRALYKLGSALSAEVAGWQAALPALNGYGATSLPGADPQDPFAAHLRIARWAFEELRRDRAGGKRVLVGHSMGGLVALLAALDGVPADALVLYEPIVLDCLDMNDPVDSAARAWDAARVDKLRDGVAGGDPEAGVKAFIEAFNEVSWSDLPAQLRADLVSKAALLAAETRAAPLVELDRSKLAALSMPVLILQGERSPPVTHRMSLRLAQAIPHAVRRVVKGAGHMGPALAPAVVASAVSPFLKSLG
jgi:pimeloyl-ACP methyl ester carboxylesterase